MTTINPFRCNADAVGATYHELCRNGREYRILAHTKADAEAALTDHLAQPQDDVCGELPSLFEL